jgi:trigger factor
MEIALDKISDTNALLKIKLIPDDYKADYDKKLKEYSRKVAVKGFRPGHAPAGLVKKMYGKGLLIDEINNILSKTVSDYIRTTKLQIVGDPVPNITEADKVDWDNQQEFDFSYEIGLASDFEVDLSLIPAVTQFDIQATETDADSTITDLRQRFHTHQHADTIEEGDTIFGELVQLDAPEGLSYNQKTGLPLNKMTDESRALFIGKAKNETLTFDLAIAFPEEKDRANATGVSVDELTDLTGDFTFTIEDITRHAPAELDQAFFDKVLGPGAISTEEELREKVLEITNQNYVRESDAKLNFDIEQALLENIPILLPDEFLKNWLLTSNEGKVTREQIEKEYDDFAKSVKLQLIKNKIAESSDDIKVEGEEVFEASRQMVLAQFGVTQEGSDEMNKVIDEIAHNYIFDKKSNGDNYRQLYNRLFDEKVIAFAKSKIDITNKAVSVEEFKSVANNEQ